MANETITGDVPAAQPLDQSLITYTNIIYALHALAVVIGVLTSTTIIGNFICGLPSIIAVIMNYARRSQVRGTFLESHFRWQIRTFWFALFWAIVIGGISFVLAFVLIGFVTWIIGALLLGIWVVYRVARGWFALRDRRPMYV
ncbi:MAG TPA: hypothetical protein VFS52_01285 [Steroidobacteraceae bacterium]|jgi:uncharacterized membrane protein|nr:hypothetical protein [Steroidobacteraceae bacterium]